MLRWYQGSGVGVLRLAPHDRRRRVLDRRAGEAASHSSTLKLKPAAVGLTFYHRGAVTSAEGSIRTPRGCTGVPGV